MNYCECAWKVLMKAALGQMARHLELVCRKEALHVLHTVHKITHYKGSVTDRRVCNVTGSLSGTARPDRPSPA